MKPIPPIQAIKIILQYQCEGWTVYCDQRKVQAVTFNAVLVNSTGKKLVPIFVTEETTISVRRNRVTIKLLRRGEIGNVTTNPEATRWQKEYEYPLLIIDDFT